MRFKKILIKTSQLPQLREFYHSVLQLPVESDSETSISIGIGESLLAIEEECIGDPFYHFAINIPSNKIEQAREWLLNKGIDLLWMNDYKSDIADFRNWNAKSVYFFDPAGNIVELIARFDLNITTTEEFSSTQFLSISEIGLVFPGKEINAQVEKIMSQCHLSYFLKQPPMEQFRVLGDDEGLFIIVVDNRNWYPTNKQSGIYPLEITFEMNNKTQLLRY